MATVEQRVFVEKLRASGMRVTVERLAILEEIFAQHGHIDAAELLRGLRIRGHRVSRATVYRNLELLVQWGMVRKQQLGGRRQLYEHQHGGQHHDHLFCRDCGKVAEFVSPGIEALQREICRAHGFDPDDHTLQIRGLCTDCSGH